MYIASYVPSYVACYAKLSCNLPLYLGSSYVHACKLEPNMLKILFQYFPKIIHYSFLVSNHNLLFPFYSLCFIVSSIDIQRNMDLIHILL